MSCLLQEMTSRWCHRSVCLVLTKEVYAFNDSIDFKIHGYSVYRKQYGKRKSWPENTQLLRKGKYHCMPDLLFDWLGFSCFAFVELDRAIQVWSNPNQSSRTSVIQWYFPYKVCSLYRPLWFLTKTRDYFDHCMADLLIDWCRFGQTSIPVNSSKENESQQEASICLFYRHNSIISKSFLLIPEGCDSNWGSLASGENPLPLCPF